MSHLDPDRLALIALGEPVASPDDRAHLAACPRCSAELAELSRTVQIARATVGDDALESPPYCVWTAIASELKIGEEPVPRATGPTVRNRAAA